jgi:hypothetical protein
MIAWGNVADGYTGTVALHLDRRHRHASERLHLLTGDHGTHDFSITLRDSGLQSVTVTDTVEPPAITGTGTFFRHIPPAAASFTVSEPRIARWDRGGLRSTSP